MAQRVISHIAGHKVITERLADNQYAARVFSEGTLECKALFTEYTREKVSDLAFDFIEKENDPSMVQFTPQLLNDLKAAHATALHPAAAQRPQGGTRYGVAPRRGVLRL